MVFSKVIVDVTILVAGLCSIGQSRAKVSAGFTNVSSLAVAGIDLEYCSRSVGSGLSLSLTLVKVVFVKWLSVCVEHVKYVVLGQRLKVIILNIFPE